MTNKFSVDRTKFLAVAAALAGIASFQACTTTKDDVAANDGGDAGETAGGHTTAGSSSHVGGQAQAGEGGGATAGTTPGGAPTGGAAEAGATTGGAAEAGAAGAAGAGMCDDSVGDPACEGVSLECTPYCNAAVAKLKPAVAVDAIGCLELDHTANCDAGYGCLSEATAKACPDDVTAACAAAAATCTDPSPSDPPCAQLLSGFTDAARAAVIDCTHEGCISVYSCAEGFYFQ